MRKTPAGLRAIASPPLPPHLRRRVARLALAVRERRALELLYGGAWRVVHPHAIGQMGTGRVGLLTWQTAGLARGPGDPGEGWRMFDVARIEGTRALRAHFAPRPRGGPAWTAGIDAPVAEVLPRAEALAELAAPG
ncbi:hypothetical protein J8J14_07185 [Roseomonas sp. SSH11]|uniref:Uncharacterized protein n=1 Tax=Pararoseomonas baculiformis TaxID=2820812 RepID=A0ABS4ADH9_9PROT|nr:hypothetical protein [Pararoseomonas baculiformis]MBP0444563.1 hypothetical protein [Pararoseomonas baculiformis]